MIYPVIPAAVSSLLRGTPFPYFRVMVQGKGIAVPCEGERDIVGFFTTRVVRADTESEAIAAAKAMVESDWRTGAYSSVNAGSLPSLEVQWVWRDSFLGALRFNNGGHIFYLAEDEEAGPGAVV